MASMYYDWHFARSQNRMEQKPLFDNGIQVEKYHHKNGLVLTFLSVVSGKQFTVLLDRDHTLEVINKILKLHPTDEILRLRLAMFDIINHAKEITGALNVEHRQAILDIAGSWPKIQEQAIDTAILSSRVEQLEKQLKEMRDAANQLVGIQAWIIDGDMKRHCAKMIDKLTK